MARIDIKGDIGLVVDQEYILQFSHKESLAAAHQIAEGLYPAFELSHNTLGRLGARAFEFGWMYRPFDVGIQTYEALAGTNFVPDFEMPRDSDEPGGAADPTDVGTLFKAGEGLVSTFTSEQAFLETLDTAKETMIKEAPVLTAAVQEIAGKHTGHDAVALDYALKGASAIRAMHIHTAS